MHMKNNLLIGFIGQGYIGKNMADDFFDRGYQVVRYDKEKNIANRERIKDCDYVFIGVPTPSTPDGFDDSILEEVIALVGEAKTAIIKSTIPVGTTEKFQDMYPDKYILHSPEFLTEKNAPHDTKFPPRNIIGYSKKAKDKAQLVMDLLPPAEHSFIVPSPEAELTKYMGNNFLFWKVVFANIFYNLSQKKGVDYATVAKMTGLDPRIGSSHLQVNHESGHSDKAGRGAGGHCFLKDMAALIEMLKQHDLSSEEDRLSLQALESIVELNNRLLIDSEKDVDLLEGVYGSID